MKKIMPFIRYSKRLSCAFLFLSISTFSLSAPLEFELSSHTLGKVNAANWADKYLLIGIGYTSCPDICPTTVIDLATASEKLAKKGYSQLVPIFISIDPKRDSAENIDLYVKYFGANMVGLTGTQAQIAQAARSLKATYGYSLEGKPIYPPLPSQYEVYHSTYLYFYGPDRELIDVFGYGEGGVKISESIAKYFSQAAAS